MAPPSCIVAVGQPAKRAGYGAIGYGCDAADLANYNQFGPAVFPVEISVSVELA